MLLFANLSESEQQNIINLVLDAYHGLTEESLKALISATNVGGVAFIGIRNYQSAESNGTETANHRVNVGASYEAMLAKDTIRLEEINLETINLDNFTYEGIDFNGLTLEEYKQAVKDALPTALAEMQAPKAEKNTDATVKFNSMLTFNTNTLNLNIFGKSESKDVKVEGFFKTTRKAPKTRAKEIIRKVQDLPTDKLRYFTLDRIGSAKIMGNELIFE